MHAKVGLSLCCNMKHFAQAKVTGLTIKKQKNKQPYGDQRTIVLLHYEFFCSLSSPATGQPLGIVLMENPPRATSTLADGWYCMAVSTASLIPFHEGT